MPEIRKIYIIGFMGSGKTTTGQKLAAALGWNFDDLDHKIEREQKKTIEEIFTLHDEEYFRKLEYDALRNIETKEKIVISAGGGAPCYSDNMDYMKKTGIVLYLRMTPRQLSDRLEGKQDIRPLIKGLSGKDLQEYIRNKLTEREPFYRKATIVMNGFDPDISSISAKIRSIISNTAV